jgi:hypothetical protein
MDNDHASERNGYGFGKYDVRIGHALADETALTQKQAPLGFKMVRKYRRQLTSLLTIVDGKVVPA